MLPGIGGFGPFVIEDVEEIVQALFKNVQPRGAVEFLGKHGAAPYVGNGLHLGYFSILEQFLAPFFEDGMEAGKGLGVAGVRRRAALEAFERKIDALLGIEVESPGIKQDAVADAEIHFPARKIQGNAWYVAGVVHGRKHCLA